MIATLSATLGEDKVQFRSRSVGRLRARHPGRLSPLGPGHGSVRRVAIEDRRPHGAQNIIEVEGVSKSYGATHALVDIDLAVPTGSVQGLLGPNGAGKTTLVRILATLLKPDAGVVRIGGVDLLRDPVTVRAMIGLAGQFAAVDETLTGRENLVMVGRLYRLNAKVAKERAAEVLQRLGLVEAANRAVKTYSGGMRRRLDVGASLVGRPRVLLLDEPTTGLDPRTRDDLWDFIRELVAEGTTVLLTTQYLEEADELADHIVIVDHGRIIATGTPNELKARLGTDLLQIAVAPSDLDRAMTLLGPVGSSPATKDVSRSQVSVPVVDAVTSLMSAVRLLDSAGLVPTAVEVHRPSLDEVFLTLTGREAQPQESGAPASALASLERSE